jgi:dethiobiotin synthetase
LNALLITAPYSQAGKTVLTIALAAYWQTYHRSKSLAILKPVDTGLQSGGDRSLYSQLFPLAQSLDEITPIAYHTPGLPPLAADSEGKQIDLATLWGTLQQLCAQRDWVLLEAFGGLGTPITHELTMANLAGDWRLPTVLVVPVTKDAIAHAVATVALARQSKIALKGIILNCIDPHAQEEMESWVAIGLLQSLTQVPVLGWLPHLTQPIAVQGMAQIAANLDLERLLPS